MLFYPLVTLDANDGKMWPALDDFTSDVLHKYAAHLHRQIGGFYNLICIYQGRVEVSFDVLYFKLLENFNDTFPNVFSNL